MPRTRRVELADGVHHVTARAPSKRLLFVDDQERETYLRLLAAQVRERRWSLMSYCLMSNHVHLLVRTPEPDLGAGIKAAHEAFAVLVNRRREEHGHLFGARFANKLVVSDQHLHGCLRYIARNPVQAGMVLGAEDYAWSAHNAIIGRSPTPDFLDVRGTLELVDADTAFARAAYAGWVERSDEAVLRRLSNGDAGPDWLASAVDDHYIELPAIAAFAGWSRATAHRRLKAARETQGSDP